MTEQEYKDRLAEQQKVIDEQRQVIEHCRERADKGEHRSRGHICDATQECMSIKQKCEKALKPKAEVES